MRRILRIIFKIFVILLLVFVGSCGVLTYIFGFRENSEAIVTANQLIPSIVSDWNEDKLKEHFSPNGAVGDFTYLDNKPKEVVYGGAGSDPKIISQEFSKLKNSYGKMKNFSGAKCKGSLIVQCEANVSFEHGNAKILMGLKNSEIISFMVMDSAAFDKQQH